MTKVITIPLAPDKVVLIDEADAPLVVRWKLSITKSRAKPKGKLHLYVKCTNYETGEIESLHNLLLPPKPPLLVDHVNGNGLDCRRENLRYATKTQNAYNRAPNRNKALSLPKGVIACGNGWRARITVNERTIHLGIYETINEAAMAYDLAALTHFGEFARFNLLEFRLSE